MALRELFARGPPGSRQVLLFPRVARGIPATRSDPPSPRGAGRGNVHFHIHLDAAGQYATNLEAFLRRLDFPKTISIGEPKRNRDYKNAHFPKRKADAVDSLACARFGVVERPPGTRETPLEFVQLRDLAGVLASMRKQLTRHINQLHNYLARVFPELTLLASNFSAHWVLTLLEKYPTAERIAAARLSSLEKLPYIDAARATQLHAAAKTSTGASRGALVEAMVRQLVKEVRQCQQAEANLSELLETAYDALPAGGHRQVETIPGIGKRTAAALVAKVVSIDRFETPERLVSYFGCFPEENTSGMDKRGRPVPKGTMRMSIKGNDLVRGLLWMAAQSAILCNPAIRALYARQRATGKRGDVALGHCVRKLLHLAFAIWKMNRPFDPKHYAWQSPRSEDETAVPSPGAIADSTPAQKDAAGRKGQQGPERKAVTAAAFPASAVSRQQTTVSSATRTLPHGEPVAKRQQALAAAEPPDSTSPTTEITRRRSQRVDFAQVRRQVSMEDVLRRLGMWDQLQGTGPQRRGPCPIHEPGRAMGRSFSVNLDKHVFRCLHAHCAAQGNVLDLWAGLMKPQEDFTVLGLAG